MTHINAYSQDVVDAKDKVAAAKAELDAAKLRLHQKEVEEGLETTVDEWKNQFFNGELYFNPGKPT